MSNKIDGDISTEGGDFSGRDKNIGHDDIGGDKAEGNIYNYEIPPTNKGMLTEIFRRVWDVDHKMAGMEIIMENISDQSEEQTRILKGSNSSPGLVQRVTQIEDTQESIEYIQESRSRHLLYLGIAVVFSIAIQIGSVSFLAYHILK